MNVKKTRRGCLTFVGNQQQGLFAQSGRDLKGLLRSGADDDRLRDEIAAVWRVRDDRYSELRTAETARQRKIEMSYIGG